MSSLQELKGTKWWKRLNYLRVSPSLCRRTLTVAASIAAVIKVIVLFFNKSIEVSSPINFLIAIVILVSTKSATYFTLFFKFFSKKEK